mgnify:CR=1 FL=1
MRLAGADSGTRVRLIADGGAKQIDARAGHVRVYDEAQHLLVMANQNVIDMLLDEEADSLAELESFINIPVKLQVESFYSQENYDVLPV